MSLRKPAVAWLLFSLVAILYALLRCRWIGHVLTWDEASLLCAVRGIVAGGGDAYTYWFWRHPPLASTLLMLVQPLREGFAERAEILLLAVNVANLLLLFVLNRRVFGDAVAFLSVLLFCLGPASMAFDVWVKPDALATFFGLLAILFWLRERAVWSGFALGLALLSKETGAFYALTIAGLWLLGEPGKRRGRDIAIVIVLSTLAMSWWYVLFSNTLKHFIEFVITGTSSESSYWQQPWTYYFGRLWSELHGFGVALLVLGVIRSLAPRRAPGERWAAMLLIVSLAVLTLSRGKPPWMTIPLYAPMATLSAIGLAALMQVVVRAGSKLTAAKRYPALIHSILPAAIAAAVFLAVGRESVPQTYERALRYVDLRGPEASRHAAETLNRMAKPGQKALVMRFYFWKQNARDSTPDPVFAYYLKDIPVVTRPWDITYEQALADIRQYQLDWALLSPQPEQGKTPEIVQRFLENGLAPLEMTGAVLFRTTSLRQ